MKIGTIDNQKFNFRNFFTANFPNPKNRKYRRKYTQCISAFEPKRIRGNNQEKITKNPKSKHKTKTAKP